MKCLFRNSVVTITSPQTVLMRRGRRPQKAVSPPENGSRTGQSANLSDRYSPILSRNV